jgi:predicted carbohydrate-binding protein with CBM5 and CBM33 domain
MHTLSQIYHTAETTSATTLIIVLDLLETVNASAHGAGYKKLATIVNVDQVWPASLATASNKLFYGRS